MNRALSLFFLLFSQVSLAENCDDIKPKFDGTPVEYWKDKCYAELKASQGNYEEAVKFYEKALSAKLHEQPNYDLRLNLGELHCNSGNGNLGRSELERYILLARAETGDFDDQCSKDLEYILQHEHIELACIGYGSALSEQGVIAVKEKIEEAKTVLKSCEKV